MHRVCGRAQAPTAGLQHAPLALGDDDERVTRGLRIEGLAAAAASTFSSTFFFDLADDATPFALLTRTNVDNLSISACCLSYNFA